MSLGIVCGYEDEARIARRITPLVAMGWNNPNAALQLIEKGAITLLSFGVAAGLDPDLNPGDLLLPEQVLVDGSYFPVSADLQGKLFDHFTLAWHEPILSSKILIPTSNEKQTLFAETKAVAADMESGFVAQAAIKAGIGFAVIRVVSDPVDHTLPAAAIDALRPDGRIDYISVIKSLLRDPFQLPGLIRTGQQNKTALRRLETIADDIRALLL